ncbi:MAG: hypothetical protein AAGB05_03830 [Pseudomonadota bacterium]
MRILITLAAAAALMAGLVVVIVLAASAVTQSARALEPQGGQEPFGGLSKVAYAVLWCLVVGSAVGLIGGG